MKACVVWLGLMLPLIYSAPPVVVGETGAAASGAGVAALWSAGAAGAASGAAEADAGGWAAAEDALDETDEEADEAVLEPAPWVVEDDEDEVEEEADWSACAWSLAIFACWAATSLARA